MFHYTVEIPRTPMDTIAALEDVLKEEQFGVLWKFNVKAKLNEKGLALDGEYYILEVCNPVEAHKVLSREPVAGYFLPCKIAIYQDGVITKVGMPKPTELIGIAGSSELRALASDVENRLIRCIEQLI